MQGVIYLFALLPERARVGVGAMGSLLLETDQMWADLMVVSSSSCLGCLTFPTFRFI